MAEEPQPIDWNEQLSALGIFYDEPDFHPEAAEAARLRHEARDPDFKKRMDDLRAKAKGAS